MVRHIARVWPSVYATAQQHAPVGVEARWVVLRLFWAVGAHKSYSYHTRAGDKSSFLKSDIQSTVEQSKAYPPFWSGALGRATTAMADHLIKLEGQQ